jgi:hypothetical protein
MLEYHCFIIGKVTTYLQCGNILVLLAIRQYEGKSYRMFVVEWLIEAYYFRTFLKLSHIPHHTTLQKFSVRISSTILRKVISSFILLLSIHRLFIDIDSSGFKATNSSQYYTDKARLRKKYLKLSLGAVVLYEIICDIKIRRAPKRHDTIDFQPIIENISEIVPVSVVVADKGV